MFAINGHIKFVCLVSFSIAINHLKMFCHDSDAENIFVGGSFGTEGTLEFIPFATLDL